MPEPGAISTEQLLLLEYERLKDEQRARIGFRDNLLYATLASVAGILVLHVQSKTPGTLLLLPPVTVLLGWTYLVNDEKISAIGRYVRTRIAPHFTTESENGQEVFGWEAAHRDDPRRRSRKRLQLAVDLLCFCGPPIGAVAVYWSAGHTAPALVAVSVAEVLATVLLAWQIVAYADLAATS
ncbi:hypothetical protein BCL76_113211 [Streptomyces sp. CG 926]|uniref:hypothetical protein n=1 Tax=Streptomyces sp. CG 926 TaxID=1882405 RepID=UPI000D6CB507|nr:hypothetical protein [Streptomyces sp. CG 926]PWK65224.1 hypothetical protein BCL76_113211 [Streptomyces sp. CG 926]